MTTDLSKIRNFSIIAHIDHGKIDARRPADPVDRRADRARDDAARCSTIWRSSRSAGSRSRRRRCGSITAPQDGEDYVLNLMDTPGHVDFAYEVSRSLAACEGALLVVDAAQGVEAQTLANVYQSIEHDHEIVPVINKIDLPAADVDKVRQGDRGHCRPARRRRAC